jgi:transglutaminase-like putative cysteine protease
MRQRSPGLTRLVVTCGALALALAPHVAHLPVWISAAFAGTVLWRLLAEQRGWALPPRALRTGAALGATLAVFAGYRTLNGLDAGTALLSVMACLKLLETRAPRDHAVLVFVGYLLCLATLLYGETPSRLAFVLLAVWLLTAALARVHRPVGADAPVRPFALAARMLALGLPLAAILFLFVPRLEGRFWAVPARAGAVTGIGDDMSPGDVASLAQSDEPALRVWFSGVPPPPEQRYWRVQVFEAFDGRAWHHAATRADATPPRVEPDGPAYRYRVVLEPTHRPWLAGLDTVVDFPEGLAQRVRSGVLLRGSRAQAPATVDARLEYELRSAPRASVMRAALPDDLRRRDLDLPAGAAPRARALATRLYAEAGSARAYVTAVLARFHDEPYEYTLDPPPLAGDTTDEFLFATRLGFCEHYAASFTVLMRAAGIPARVVVGYQGGEWNGWGDYLLVAQSSAHAWAEVWLDGEGWVRVDPTAAVAPERVHADARGLATGADRLSRAVGNVAWLARARQLVDAARTAWYSGVVNFDASSQQRLLERLGLGDEGLRGLAIALTVGFVLAALALAAWLAWELRPPRAEPLARAWREVCMALAGRGLVRAPAEGPLDYARRVAAARPDLARDRGAFADAYVAARYLPGPAPGSAAALGRLGRDLRARLRRGTP